MKKTQVPSLDWEDPLEKGMATHFSILAWRIPWTEELDRLQSMGSQRVGHDWAPNAHMQGPHGVGGPGIQYDCCLCLNADRHPGRRPCEDASRDQEDASRSQEKNKDVQQTPEARGEAWSWSSRPTSEDRNQRPWHLDFGLLASRLWENTLLPTCGSLYDGPGWLVQAHHAFYIYIQLWMCLLLLSS